MTSGHTRVRTRCIERAIAFHCHHLPILTDVVGRHKSSRTARHQHRETKSWFIEELCASVYFMVAKCGDAGLIVFWGNENIRDQYVHEPIVSNPWDSGVQLSANFRVRGWDSYYQAVTENLPPAEVVFDWFHVVKLLNEKLTQLRRDIYREATKMDKQIFKGRHWLLLQRPKNLNDVRDESKRLKEAQLNSSLATAYYLKEDLRLLWATVAADCEYRSTA